MLGRGCSPMSLPRLVLRWRWMMRSASAGSVARRMRLAGCWLIWR